MDNTDNSSSIDSDEFFSNNILTTKAIPISSRNIEKFVDLEVKDEYNDENIIYKAISPKKLNFTKISDLAKSNKIDDNNTKASLKQQNKLYPHLKFSYILDSFQRISIEAILKNESVLVAAHTSSGKTVVAEYAIALALSQNKKLIYTSPIKALSNQKFRDLNDRFADFGGNKANTENENIGLMTGDTTLNPTANCIVMTTEILRSMLYRQNDLLNDVAYIVFDEVHYMRDKERGVVWEESISLTNMDKFNVEIYDNIDESQRKLKRGRKKVCIFLSATIPNALSFAEWISHIHYMNCHLVCTHKRPTPLSHFIVPAGGEGMYKIMEDNNSDTKKGADGSKKNQKLNVRILSNAIKEIRNTKIRVKDIVDVINSLESQNLLPCIVFSFRRKDCESYALRMEDKDYLSEEEKENVEIIFENALATLQKEDRDLKLVKNILPLLKRGIGIHHSGLVPIIREIVEILFTENLIKLLLSTETFAIGLNVPAKSVLFTSLRKFDGEAMRIVSVSEYMQMSGRSGRRGIDNKGICVSIINNLTLNEGIRLFSGDSEDLVSKFQLSYNMVLNITRSRNFLATEILKRTFFYFLNKQRQLKLKKKIIEKEKIINENDKEIEIYLSNLLKKEMKNEFTKKEMKNEFIKKFKFEIMKFIDVESSSKYVLLKEEYMKKTFEDFKELSNKINRTDLTSLKTYRNINIKTSNDLNIEMQEVETGSVILSKVFNFFRSILKIYSNLYRIDIKDLRKGNMVDLVIPINFNVIYLKNCLIEVVTPYELEVFFVLSGNLYRRTFSKNFIHRVFLGNFQKNENTFKLESLSTEFERFDSLRVGEFNQKKILNKDELKIFNEFYNTKKCCFCKKFISIECIDGECESSNSEFCYNINTERNELLSVTSILIKSLKLYNDFLSQNKNLSKLIEISFLSRFNKMTNFLIEMNYIKTYNIGNFSNILESCLITIKGRVACEITNNFEIILTELLFNNFFIDLTTVDVASLLSCFVCDEKEEVELSDVSKKLFSRLQKIDDKIYEKIVKYETDEDRQTLSKVLMDPIRLWALGNSFDTVCASTPVFEGSIIRVMKQLEEVLRQLGNAARVMGNLNLENLFADTISLIKRGIVFANSLYL